MKITSSLRFVVGSALLIAPTACGPDAPEEVPIRTSVGGRQPEAPTNVGRDDTDDSDQDLEGEGENPTPNVPEVPEVTMEATDVSPDPDPAPSPSADTTIDPLINPSSGERFELRPDAPYQPTQAR